MTRQRLYTNADGGFYLEFDHHARELRIHRNPGYTVSIPMDTASMIRSGLRLALTGYRIEAHAADEAYDAAKRQAVREVTAARCFEDGGRSWGRDLLQAVRSAEDATARALVIEKALVGLAKVGDVASASNGAASVLAAVTKPSRGGLFS